MTRGEVEAARSRSGTILCLLVAGLLGAACSPVGDPGLPPEPVPPPEPEPEEEVDPRALPPLEDGEPRPGGPDVTAELLDEAEMALAAGDLEEAREAALQVIDEHPTVPGSSAALWVLARAALEMGDFGVADQAALDYLDLLPEDHPQRDMVRLLRADAGFGDGRAIDAVGILSDLAVDAPESLREEVLERVRFHSQVLLDDELDEAAELSPGGLREGFRVERALRFHFDGEDDRARETAEEVLAGEPADEEERLAEAVLEDRVEDLVGAAVSVGALLPEDGPPSVMRTGEAIAEGLEVALESLEKGTRRELRILSPGEGDDGMGRERIRELEEEGALAIIGPFEGRELVEVAEARETGLPVLSLTARVVPEEVEGRGVYGLRTNNPRAQEDLARHAREEGHSTAVILRPDEDRTREKAEAFRRAFEDDGGRVLRDVTYPSGQADLADELERVKDERPDLLFLPLPSEHVEMVATQISFHQVAEDEDDEDYELALYGTRGWDSDEALRDVAPRHTEGVVLSVRAPAGENPLGYDGFVEAYEAHFRQTFRKPEAALGWDAVGILSEALRTGARSGPALAMYLERVEGFEGATGTLSVRHGRIVAEQQLARVEDGEVRPLDREDRSGERGDRPY